MSEIESIGDSIGIDLDEVKRKVSENIDKLETRSGALGEYANDIQSAVSDLDIAAQDYERIKSLLDNIDSKVQAADYQADDAWNTAEAFEIDN